MPQATEINDIANPARNGFKRSAKHFCKPPRWASESNFQGPNREMRQLVNRISALGGVVGIEYGLDPYNSGSAYVMVTTDSPQSWNAIKSIVQQLVANA